MLCWTISRVRVRGIQAGGGRSAVRCCGLFLCLYAWRGSAGDWPPVAVPCPASRCARLRDLKVCAPALPLRGCGFIRTTPLRRLRRGAPAPPGARLPRRVARRSGLLAAPASRLLRFAPAAVAASLRGSAPPLLPGGSVGRGSALALVGRRCRCRPSRVGRRSALAALGRPCRRRPPGPAPRRALLPAPLPRGGCAAAWPVAALPPGGRLVGVPPPRVLARCGAGVAAAAGKEKAGLAAGFPEKRRIRTPFSCR